METNLKLIEPLETGTWFFTNKACNFGFIVTYIYNDNSIKAVRTLETSLN